MTSFISGIRQKMHSKSGFTVLEILIVVALFGLLATLAAISLNTARSRMRDAKRLSDISQIHAGISQYYLEQAKYPEASNAYLGKPGSGVDLLTEKGFAAKDADAKTVYLKFLPVGPRINEFYKYHGGLNGYSLRFQTESDTSFGKANVYYAHADGVDLKDEEK